jgi:3-methylcrotonyl-CoA carboxylase beta subunit
LQIARNIVNNLNYKHPPKDFAPLKNIQEPKFDPEEMYGIVGTNLKRSFDVREVRKIGFE